MIHTIIGKERFEMNGEVYHKLYTIEKVDPKNGEGFKPHYTVSRFKDQKNTKVGLSCSAEVYQKAKLNTEFDYEKCAITPKGKLLKISE